MARYKCRYIALINIYSQRYYYSESCGFRVYIYECLVPIHRTYYIGCKGVNICHKYIFCYINKKNKYYLYIKCQILYCYNFVYIYSITPNTNIVFVYINNYNIFFFN